ncbi:MAG: MFS transporter [Gammaproteobacteria bacterium]
MHKQAFALATIGTLLEWAEYTFYGYMALTLSQLFFPANEPHIALIKTFSIFAFGYFMRPLGAVIFGHIGDKLGRKPALMVSMFLMGIATLGMGLMPTYHQIGVLAPLGLLVLRTLQGIAVSGEYHGAGIFLIEKFGSRRPCFVGSLIPASAAMGMVIGGFAAMLVSLPGAPTWAWRVPFLMGGLGCWIAWILRCSLSETSVFLEAKSHHALSRIPLLTTLRDHWRSLIFTAGVAAIVGVYVYIGNIYLVTFLHHQAHLSQSLASMIAMLGELLTALLIPLMGWWADHVNPKQMLKRAIVAIMFGGPMIFGLCQSGNALYLSLAMLIYALLNAALCAPMVKVLFDLFPAGTRFTGNAFAWNIAVAIFSSTAPMIAKQLHYQFNWIYGPGIYISLIAIIAYVCLQFKDQQNETTHSKPYSVHNQSLRSSPTTFSGT